MIDRYTGLRNLVSAYIQDCIDRHGWSRGVIIGTEQLVFDVADIFPALISNYRYLSNTMRNVASECDLDANLIFGESFEEFQWYNYITEIYLDDTEPLDSTCVGRALIDADYFNTLLSMAIDSVTYAVINADKVDIEDQRLLIEILFNHLMLISTGDLTHMMRDNEGIYNVVQTHVVRPDLLHRIFGYLPPRVVDRMYDTEYGGMRCISVLPGSNRIDLHNCIEDGNISIYTHPYTWIMPIGSTYADRVEHYSPSHHQIEMERQDVPRRNRYRYISA